MGQVTSPFLTVISCAFPGRRVKRKEVTVPRSRTTRGRWNPPQARQVGEELRGRPPRKAQPEGGDSEEDTWARSSSGLPTYQQPARVCRGLNRVFIEIEFTYHETRPLKTYSSIPWLLVYSRSCEFISILVYNIY